MGLNACYAEINPYICIWCISLLTVARLADTYYYISVSYTHLTLPTNSLV